MSASGEIELLPYPEYGEGKTPGLTTDVARQIVQALELGLRAQDAFTAAKVAEATYYYWLRQARELKVTLSILDEADRPALTPYQQNMLTFLESVESARPRFKLHASTAIASQIQGGQVIRRRVTKRKQPDGSETEVVDEAFARPDGRLALELLGRLFPDEYGRRTLVDVQGRLTMEVTDETRAIVASSFGRVLEARATLKERTGGDAET